MNITRCLFVLIGLSLTSLPVGCSSGAQALPSWNDSASRDSIINFVESVTDKSSLQFVPPAQRIAVFDNDGTLWSEQPLYFQLLFALDRIHQLAPDHPEWRTTQPFQAVLENDKHALASAGMEGVAKLIAATHAGMTTEQFARTVRDWTESARHPRTSRPYTEMVYQPMLEVLDYLRDNGFRTYIVSGGGVEFMRVFAEEVYGIPPEQVIGSSIKTEYIMTNRGPAIRRLPEIDFIDDKAGKPVAINKFIGRRPIAAFGNSDGDLQMLQWTNGAGALTPRHSLCVIIRHTDAQREWAYDRDSHIGRLDKALDEASRLGWTVVDMQADWNVVYPRD